MLSIKQTTIRDIAVTCKIIHSAGSTTSANRIFLFDKQIQSFRFLAFVALLDIEEQLYDDHESHKLINKYFKSAKDIRRLIHSLAKHESTPLVWHQLVEEQIFEKYLLQAKEVLNIDGMNEKQNDEFEFSVKDLNNIIKTLGWILCPEAIYSADETVFYSELISRCRFRARDLSAILYELLGEDHIYSSYIFESMICSGNIDPVQFVNRDWAGMTSMQYEKT